MVELIVKPALNSSQSPMNETALNKRFLSLYNIIV